MDKAAPEHFAEGHRDVDREKKQGRLRACDQCRRRKVRCEGEPDRPCLHCRATQSRCVHSDSKKRGPKISYPDGYVEGLEAKVIRMAAMLKQLHPDQSVSSEFSDITTVSTTAQTASDTEDETKDLIYAELMDYCRENDMNCSMQRYSGASSALVLLKDATDLRKGCAPSDSNGRPGRRLKFWTEHQVHLRTAAQSAPIYTYPEPDLLFQLVNVYFSQINPYFPVLHSPTFRRSLAAGLHFRDCQFGSVVLLVCALGSRILNDPRVFSDGDSMIAGWKFFEQVPLVKHDLLSPPTLYELQTYALAVHYLPSTNCHSCWTLIGIGLRYCVENGVHRRKRRGYVHTFEDELKKRAFWILLITDRFWSSFLGRPPTLYDEEYDAELPIECDDEFWQFNEPNGPLTFNQPPDRPSKISFLNQIIELIQILGTAIRCFYPDQKIKQPMEHRGEKWEQSTLEQLRLRLEEWRKFLPNHLQWQFPPRNEDTVLFIQSAMVQTVYHITQIQLHRPFIRKASVPYSQSSLACVNSARDCLQVIYMLVSTHGIIFPHSLAAVFLSNTVLLTKIWGAHRSGLVNVNEAPEWRDIENSVRVLRLFEDRWPIAGQFVDLLEDLFPSRSILSLQCDAVPGQVGTTDSPSKSEQSVFDSMNVPLSYGENTFDWWQQLMSSSMLPNQNFSDNASIAFPDTSSQH